jgi:hypothetical protein
LSHDKLKIRKMYNIVDENLIENGRKLVKSVKKSCAIAIIENPFAGKYSENLSLLYSYGEDLGGLLGKAAIKGLGITEAETLEGVESYGKAAIIGVNGELEHGHAILHPKFGAPLRSVLGGIENCKAIIPSTIKMGSINTTIDIPLHYKNSEWVVSHVDSMEVSVPDAPRSNEILVAVAITNSQRPLARTIGLKKQELN